MLDTSKLTIKKSVEMMNSGELTSEALVYAHLEVSKVKNLELNAYVDIFDDAIASAREADKKRKNGDKSSLLGIPLAIKNNILIKGKRATACSKILENYTATYDATAIANLKQAGAIMLGSTNMDEFAFGSSTQTSVFGPTRNPHDTSRVPGGSSGGSVVAVAANMALGALGTDTCGSVRQPSGWCGTVALKTTYGVVSRSGAIAMGSSLDQISPIAKNVEDVELLFNSMRGHDPLDATSEDYNAHKFVPTERQAKRIGIPWKFVEKGLAEDVLNNFKKTADELKSKGYEIVDIELPNAEHALPAYYIVVPAEISANLARYDGVRFGLHVDGKDLLEDYKFSRAMGFGKEVRRRIMIGAYILSHGYYDAYYNKAKSLRKIIAEDFDKVFTGADSVSAIMIPTSPGPAFKIGEKSDDPVEMYLEDIFTAPTNITGTPSLAVQGGTVSREGKDLPQGVQFMAPRFGEDSLIKLGKSLGR
ncbi:MAG: Asp-tRNA(Asn)/Glu-tRNA(Gln) amidotransferase subunit GatA [Candidatus Vogelbacteria bacterium]|nr:Asp-tRNA(Asn)/Glu-tRNA(Gln) amidotransferase subunit GatA [Candidatus Vogelbacteria bacterium]